MFSMSNIALRKILLILACVAIIIGCASIEKGYLSNEVLPDSVALLPPPPSAGLPDLALDEKVSRKNLDLRDTPRWELAREDANLNFPEAAGTFSCALNAPITEQDTPHLYKLLRLIKTDAGNSTKRAKEKYQRPRPFLVNKKPICTPSDEEFLKNNGSYPSGHAAIGWAWALVLAEIAPEKADAIRYRGRVFGESRIICNVHWYSDVINGHKMGAAVIKQLHDDPMFRADVKAAKHELAAVRAKGLKPQRDCAWEASAMIQ